MALIAAETALRLVGLPALPLLEFALGQCRERSVERRNSEKIQRRSGTLQSADIFTNSFTNVVKWKHALSLIQFGTIVTDKPASFSNPPPSLPKKEGGAPVAYCLPRAAAAIGGNFNNKLLLIAERLAERLRLPTSATYCEDETTAKNQWSRGLTHLPAHPSDGCYNRPPPPEVEPNENGGSWRAIIKSDDCMLGMDSMEGQATTGWVGSTANEMLMPTKHEWKMVESIFEEGMMFTTEMFTNILSRLIQYRDDQSELNIRTVWIPCQVEGDTRVQLVQRLRGLYKGIGKQEQQMSKADDLYNRIFQFTKAMYLTKGNVGIPPFIVHGWQAQQGAASDIWWVHPKWVKACAADNALRMKQFHEDVFANSIWNAQDIYDASLGVTAERSYLNGRRKALLAASGCISVRQDQERQ
eukprot:1330615-Amphidinium_carterae.3